MAIPRNLATFANTLNSSGQAPAAGSNTQVQYNNSGVFAGSSNLTFNGTTLTANTLNLGNALGIAYGGTNSTTTPTNGGVAYGNGTAYAFTAAGTSGQVLTSNGAAAPTWQSASGGAVVKISSATFSRTNTLTVTSGISSTYQFYRLIFMNLYDSLGAGPWTPLLQWYANGSVDTNNVYYYSTQQSNTGAAWTGNGQAGTNFFRVFGGASLNSLVQEGTSVIDFSYDSTNYIISAVVHSSGGQNILGVHSSKYTGAYGNAGPVTGFNLYSMACQGSWVLYGWN